MCQPEQDGTYGDRGRGLYSIQDTAAAAENMMLAAFDRGIGSCWVGAFNEQAVIGALMLPTGVRPLAIIPMGYPVEFPEKSKRMLKEVVHQERY